MREGSGHSLSSAARLLGVKPPTLAAYEAGRFEPSERLFWRIVGTLALGKPSKGEVRPRFLVTFWFFGQQFLANGDGRVFVFADPAKAERQVEQLEVLAFTGVGVIPAWTSALAELVREHGAETTRGDDVEEPLAALVSHVRLLADEFELRLQGASHPPQRKKTRAG
jgi:hypothetical protein